MKKIIISLILVCFIDKLDAQWQFMGLNPNNGNFNVVNCIVIKNDTIFAGTNNSGAYFSANAGSSWTPILPNYMMNDNITALAISGNNIFIETNINGLYLSSNNGSSWSKSYKGLPSNFVVNSFAINDTNFFASVFDQTGKSNSGIYLSTNNGNSWHYVGGVPSNAYMGKYLMYLSFVAGIYP